jgi:hypothetical protein
MTKSRFRKEFTDEERAEFKKEMLERRAKLTLAYQLGYYVGEQIVDKFLPTLSCDALQTRKVISVRCDEGDECKRLHDIWFNKTMEYKRDDEGLEASKGEWASLRAYHEMLEEKYLPATIDCHFQLLNVTEENMADFKKGVGIALWDCDCSHYLCEPEDIEVEADEDGWFTNIKLKRG